MNDIFSRRYKKYDAWYDRHKWAFLSELEAVRKVLPRGRRGLEIGVGTGRFAAALGVTLGIDPSSRMLTLARRRGVHGRVAYGEDIPFPGVSFDYVVIIIALCFVRDPRKVLQEARRVLKKNGKIVVGIVDKESFLGRFYHKKKSIFYQQAKFFSVREVTDMLREAGFVSFSYYQTLSRLPGSIFSVEKPQKGFGRGGFVVIGAKKGREVRRGCCF